MKHLGELNSCFFQIKLSISTILLSLLHDHNKMHYFRLKTRKTKHFNSTQFTNLMPDNMNRIGMAIIHLHSRLCVVPNDTVVVEM